MKEKLILVLCSLAVGYLVGVDREHKWWTRNPSQVFNTLARELERSPWPRDKYLSGISYAVSYSAELNKEQELWTIVAQWSKTELDKVTGNTNKFQLK